MVVVEPRWSWRLQALRHPPTTALTAAGWAVGIAITAAIVGTPYLVFAYHSPAMHLVLDTVDACIAFLVAYLLHGRYVRSRHLRDLLLSQALTILAVSGLALTLFLDQLSGLEAGPLEVWLPLTMRVTGAGLVAAAAVAPDRLVGQRWQRRAQSLPWAAMAVAFVVLLLARDYLPVALAESPPDTPGRPVISGHPLLVLSQSFSAICFLLASVLFTMQAVRRYDELLRWLGPACALAAFARVNYMLVPSLYSGWLYTGDILRTAGYVLLLVGAGREISQYWFARTRAAVLEDRRRLARELHDGVVQELGFIRSESHRLRDTPAGQNILASCDRALDEARAAVDTLGRSPQEPLGFVLHRAARQVAERYDALVDVEIDDSVSAEAEQRHALVRITREAVSNAIRHGKAQRISLRLTSDRAGRALFVQDDGQGFDVDEVRRDATGYGLVSMEERARAFGGSFSIESAPGRGTTVTVRW